MRTKLTFMLASFALACAPSSSTFNFDMKGDVNETVESTGGATGEIDNAGNLALEDTQWSMNVKLPGIAPDAYTLGSGIGGFAFVVKATGDTFTTASGGTCTVNVSPHASSNGSPVKMTFYCNGLASADGTKTIDIANGALRTLIDDASNDPNLAWPWP